MKKENSKIIKTIKILTIVLAIILVSMISFFGIYKQNKNQISNTVKKYSYAMDINGARTIKLQVNSEEKGETLTEENYKKAKQIIEKRLKILGVGNYNISLNEKTGEMNIEIPEKSNTDKVVGNIYTTGKFEIIDSESKEILLDNSNIKSSDVLYNTTSTGTAVYLEIAFNKEGKNKLNEISKTYVETEQNNTTVENTVVTEENTTENTSDTTKDTTANTTDKKITMKIDEEEIMTTSFDEPITDGKIQLSIGTATADTSTLEDYVQQAQNVATVLDSGNLPIQYDIQKNQYVLSSITEQELLYIAISIAVIAAIGIIVLIFKHKLNGLLAGFSYVGLAAIYMLLIRYANVTISIESIFGIIIILILNYILTSILLNNIEKIRKDKKENIVNKAIIETYTKFFARIIPICIMVIAFCFVKWVPISSFGMISFWGLALIAVYNAIITRILLKIKVERE